MLELLSLEGKLSELVVYMLENFSIRFFQFIVDVVLDSVDFLLDQFFCKVVTDRSDLKEVLSVQVEV